MGGFFWALVGVMVTSGLIAAVERPPETIGYTASELITIIAALGVLASSIVGGVVTIISTLRNGVKTDKLTVAVVGNEQTQGLVSRVQEIHTVTNSNLAAANSKIDNQTLEIKALQDMVRELKTEREKKELAVATQAMPPGVAAKK